MIAILTVFSIGALFALQFPAGAVGLRASFRTVPFLTQLFAAASYQLSWSIYVSDYSRYLPRDVERARLVLVDLPRGLHRRCVDDAGRHDRRRHGAAGSTWPRPWSTRRTGASRASGG